MAKIRQALAKYYHDYPQEKVYLQLDRQSYTGGETIWFSGIITRLSKPAANSNTLYVELFNDKGFIIDRCMLQARTGSAYGDFLLPKQLKEGKYFIRAYTAWMLNFSSELFFYQEIAVTGKGKPPAAKTTSEHADFSVQFFPEAGNLVSRLTSLVVFKALDTNGSPVAVTGKIFNNLGDSIAVLKTTHEGMGSFIIHSSPQAVYTAIVTANGITKKIPLPPVQNSGIVFHTETHTNTHADSIFFHISRTGIQKEQFENLILCAQMENHFSVTKIHFDASTFNDPMDTIMTAPFPLLLNNFGPGILQLSVLNQAGLVLAERLVFLRHGEAGKIKLQAAANNNTAGKITFTLSLPDDYDGTLAVAVTDAGTSIPAAQMDTQAGVFRTGTTTSTVNNLGWYVDAVDAAGARALDELLVTCKARTDAQKLLNHDNPIIKYWPEQSITLKGRAFEKSGAAKTPLVNGTIFLIVKAASDSLTKPLSVETDTAGFFTLPNLSFHDTANIYVQTGVTTSGHTNNTVAVEFYKTVFDSLSKLSFVAAPFVLNKKFYYNGNDNIAGNLPANTGARMLQNVVVTAKTRTHLDSVLAKYASGIFAGPGAWAQTLDLTNDLITQNTDQDVLAWLNGKVAGLNYSYSNGKPLISWRFSNVIAGLSGADQVKLNAPAFFLNENMLSAGPEGYDAAIDILSGVRMADVVMIRIFKPGTMPNVPDNGPHGTIAIYLKNGTEATAPQSRIVFDKSTATGYKMPQQFDEDAGKAKNGATVYWNPRLAVDTVTHSASFSIAGSAHKNIRIVAEGVSKDGRVVRLNQLVQ